MDNLLTEAAKAHERGDTEKASRLYGEVLDSVVSEDEQFAAHMGMASLYEDREDFLAALQSLKQALELRPDAADAWNNLGLLLRKMDRSAEAAEALQRAYRNDPENADYLVNLGSLHLKESDPGTAKTYLDLALQLEPNHAVGHANLALVLAVFGRIEEAEEHIRLATVYGFDSPEPILERIAKMKQIRSSIYKKAEQEHTQVTGEQRESQEEADEERGKLVLLNSLEHSIRALVKQQHDLIHDTEDMEQKSLELDEHIETIRSQIRTLRKELGLPEVNERDKFMGENYMLRDDERSQLEQEPGETGSETPSDL
ncbi:MAG: hypothetical protein CL946_04470 [Ectothiorhodospiraceae bacterium]|nr:hypothetical protein [Ectothiorhodospiraceae bacterium]